MFNLSAFLTNNRSPSYIECADFPPAALPFCTVVSSYMIPYDVPLYIIILLSLLLEILGLLEVLGVLKVPGVLKGLKVLGLLEILGLLELLGLLDTLYGIIYEVTTFCTGNQGYNLCW